MILLIDAYNALHRARINFGSVKNDYLITYNFLRNLKATIEQFNPEEVFIIWEGPNLEYGYKYIKYQEYKANRKSFYNSEENKNVKLNATKIKELLTYLPVKQMCWEGTECDDVISVLAHHFSSLDKTSLIYSNDSDFIQLLQKDLKVLLYNPIKKNYTSAPNYNYLIWKILRGDKSDNIKSIEKPKKAEELAKDPSKLNDWIDTDNNELFELNKILIELQETNQDIVNSIPKNLNKFNLDKLKQEFFDLNFKSLLEDKYLKKFESVFNKLVK